MNRFRALPTQRDEQGVAMVLALAFILLVGVVTTALLASLTSAIDARVSLDTVRDRQYAAEAGIEYAIASVRGLAAPGAGLTTTCPSYNPPQVVNAVPIHVDCTNISIPTITGFVQRNVVFTSCPGTTPCTTANTIVRAQVNYEAQGSTITKTYIQSWTVAR